MTHLGAHRASSPPVGQGAGSTIHRPHIPVTTRGAIFDQLTDDVTIDETALRAVITAGREAGRASTGNGKGSESIDAPAYRTVATALLGQRREAALDVALDTFATGGDGPSRFEAMVTRARELYALTSPAPSETPDPATVAWISLSHATVELAFVRALARRREHLERMSEMFSTSVAQVVEADGFENACTVAATAMRELSGMQAAALYIPSEERARYVAAARDETEHVSAPLYLRVDRGLFADVIAGERVAVVSGHDSMEALSSADMPVRSLVAVPLRDTLNRPIGLAVAMATEHEPLPLATVEALRRFGTVVAGVLDASQRSRRQYSALATLPQIASVAQETEAPVTDQLERLAEIVVLASDSDSAVVRIADAAGRYVDTRAVYSRRGDAVSDLVGARTDVTGGAALGEFGIDEHEIIDLPDALDWSDAGRRIIDTLGGRTIASFPIPSLYGRPGMLYVVRKTARPLDEADMACARIVVANMQNTIDRHVSELQTSHAITAARSAIRLLGEALVAGVQTERTLRFVPRLYHEMFACAGCRVWRSAPRSQGLTLVAGAGTVNATHGTEAVEQAATSPLELFLATQQRPHLAAVGIQEYHGTSIVIEFELHPSHTLGAEEQLLAVEVAGRISEALYSAEQSVVHQQQLERVRALQNIVAKAHEQLTETHVVSTIIDEVPVLYRSHAAAVFVIDDSGHLETRAVRDLPTRLTHAIEEARHWVPDAVGDERTATLLIERVGEDPRLASLHDVIKATGFEEHSALMIPLTGRDRTVGCLMLFFIGMPQGIDTERNLPGFAHHVGAALLNAREHERERGSRLRLQRVLEHERDQSRQVRALYEISRTFATSLSRDETMRAVVEAISDRLDVDAVWLRTPDERGDTYELRAFHSPHVEMAVALERMVGVPIPRDDAVTQHVVKGGEPMLITRTEDVEKHFAEAPTLRRLMPFLQRGSSVAILPVETPNEVLGTITMLTLNADEQLNDEKIDIAVGVASQAALAIDHARLYEQQKRFAEVIHDSLLPSVLPHRAEIELGVLYRSATKGDGAFVGGDFYDFLELDDGRLAMVIGDVCGKGIGAAADTAMTKYIFRALARENTEPAAFLKSANEVICEEITPGKFVTLFYAVIDSANHTISCGKAGHPEPKLVREDANGEVTVQSVALEGLALGIMNDQDYEQREYEFSEGTSIVMYTDGVVEARLGSKLYGQYRLEKLLRDIVEPSNHRLGDSSMIAYSIYEACSAYAEGGLDDDVAIIVAKHVSPDDENEDESHVQFATESSRLREVLHGNDHN